MGDTESNGDGGDYPSQSRTGVEIQGQNWIRPIQKQPLQKQPLTSIGVQDWTSQEQLGPIRQNGRGRTNWGL